ncbi:MAG: UDP-glucose/GDP-mannose dehydrogenase family protein [Halorhodospira halophila]|uniref:UDP-glucose dehydrogenase family protein n=1 Tax=Halorhodospira TaxID=85108 RepID=UPI0019120404|nr:MULTISPECIES: UDP-glucose/GDP-mannose dehydrogenase family protein [Halorhodospira]MBK5944488.1 UDP-glucose 6-dehydrogenase [Halorhodospira halophila]MCC3750806.1 UDP-glucose/GDP-mannose dehydrogenase family protein [Halorhodospira halophila]MCG5527391.1 UDP-glucose/GDP-mannose dehydrogenase family protein [Halorhodospira halophila]MCG5532889.1 UDP-glucose/GDP-mannose dehydrogenase family protein [Halorhodospira sp. 9621]MCG5538469.1 UDP-glucose/GDP-mannose dehydrogenase family protein [Hal
MKVTIFGSGYVGLVTGTCFADAGNDVVCVDIDAERVAQLRSGEVPIYEPGLDEMLSFNQEEGRLRFTTDAAEGVHHGLFQFIAVGTPPDEDGSADLQHVLAVARSIGQHMNDYRVVVNKSTVPVGTADRVRAALGEELAARGEQLEYDVVSNPEFLKEGAAIDDFVKPDRIIVGTDNPRTGELMKALYAPFNRNHDRLLTMDVRAAELTKYASNAMLATKISFMNELSSLAERLGADIEQVRVGMGSDPRIGYHFIYPGCGYGGSCFPKDVKALTHTAHEYDYRPELLEAVENVNDRQKRLLVRRLHAHFGEDLAGRTFGLWGLAFKPNTDDMREAPSRVVMEALWEAGARVQAYDPEAMDEAERVYGNRQDLELCDNLYDAVEDADALIVCTEWQVFRSPDFERIRDALRQPVVFDGRNVYPPSMMEALGFTYYGMGRGESIRRPL